MCSPNPGGWAFSRGITGCHSHVIQTISNELSSPVTIRHLRNIIIIIMSCHRHGYPRHFLLPLPIVHRFRQVLRATPRILTELLYVGSSWLPCFCSAMWRGPKEYITYEFVPTFPAVSFMSGSSNLDSFRDRWSVAMQVLFCGVLRPGTVQYSCVVAVKLFLQPFW